MTPEEKARQQIDLMLAASGWTVQTKDQVNLSAARGVAICELAVATGEPDYFLLFPLPPPDDQTWIVAELERRLSVVEELEAVVSANLERATRLHQSVMQKAFSGRSTKERKHV